MKSRTSLNAVIFSTKFGRVMGPFWNKICQIMLCGHFCMLKYYLISMKLGVWLYIHEIWNKFEHQSSTKFCWVMGPFSAKICRIGLCGHFCITKYYLIFTKLWLYFCEIYKFECCQFSAKFGWGNGSFLSQIFQFYSNFKLSKNFNVADNFWTRWDMPLIFGITLIGI